MSNKLTGRLHQGYELKTGPEARGRSDGQLDLYDPELIEQVLGYFGVDEVNGDALRSVLWDDPRAAATLLDDPRVRRAVARGIASGAIIARHEIISHHFPSDLVSGQGPDEEEPDGVEEFVRDWWFHCEHHISPYAGRAQENRNAFGRRYRDRDGKDVTVIDVVPNFPTENSIFSASTPAKETVTFLWKDEELGHPPKPRLFLNTTGKPEAEVPANGADAGYAKYPFEVEYLGDQDIWAFFLPKFWSEFGKTTQYRLSHGPQPLRVDVHHPRKFKFEFSMPELKSYSRGYRLGADSADVRKLAHPSKLKDEIVERREGWGDSELTTRSSTFDDRSKFSPTGEGWSATEHDAWARGAEERDRQAGIEWSEDAAGSRTKAVMDKVSAGTALAEKLPIKFSRDDVALDPGGLLTTIGTILRLYALITSVITAIKEYAPKVGFYIDFDLQLFAGNLAFEWMWKEHEDHRAFQSIDVSAKLTTIQVSLELGVGVSGAGGKLQVYAQVEGSHEFEAAFKRISPDGDAQIPFSSTFAITGAIGARAEAGTFVQLHGKGQTGFEMKFEISFGFGPGTDGVTFAVTPKWTGLSFTGTFSAGAFGISYQKTGKYDLVGPKSFERLRWPDKKPYRPPVMSKHDIARIFKNTIQRGWDIRVFRGDDRVSADDVCDRLAEATMADRGFTQTPKDIEALANAVRADLDVMGARDWRRDWVEMSDLVRYLAGGTVRGCSFAEHLREGQRDPLLNQNVG